MWIVRLALRRPYTFVVAALLILILGVFSILRMPTDIFPDINIPVVTVVWNFNGLSAEEMAQRITINAERSMTTSVNDVEHIESQSLTGISVTKVFLQPHANVASAIAQITSVSQTQLRSLPTGSQPPFIIQYNASTVPVLMLGLSGRHQNEQQTFDISQNVIRTQLSTIEGAQTPYPYGGMPRQIQVDLNLHALQAHGLSPADVVSAISTQNLIAPGGTIKVGGLEYAVETNSAPKAVEELNNLPIRNVNGAMIYVRDVAHVRDGFAPQTNIVRVDGKRAVMMAINKTGSASTLDIINHIKEKLAGPVLHGQLPEDFRVIRLSDQSIFVKGAISGVVKEAIIAACLTAVMILVFLGSWRSTVIIAASIPLSILCSLIMLDVLGETINIMTLGGLALAVGILVDDATVAIENINRNLEAGKELEQSILDGSAQIAVPALVSTLSICIVFVPMFLLSGVARYLFVPMAEAVVFAMLSSYLLSRTLVPTMAKYLLKEQGDAEVAGRRSSRNPLVAFQSGFEASFNAFRNGYLRILTLCVDHAKVFLALFLIFAIGSVVLLVPQLGQDFFPAVDSGQFKIHIRARTGTRIEETAALCDKIDNTIREIVPSKEIVTVLDNVGLPYSGMNLAYTTSAPIGPSDADIQVQLTEDHHPTGAYVERLRTELARQYPGVMFYVLPVDIVTQILNFGLSAPIDLQIIGPRLEENRQLASRILDEVRYVPGVADARIQQPFDYPKMTVNVDRTRAAALGFTQKDAAQAMLVALSGSFQTSPSFYLDPRTGVTYNVAVMAPQNQVTSLDALRSLPVTSSSSTSSATVSTSPSTAAPGATGPVSVLGNMADLNPGAEMGVVSHYNTQPVLDIFANVNGSDLGSVTHKVEDIMDRHKEDLPRGSGFSLRGQSATMRSSYSGLLIGMLFSILLVYLLIVVNFQSWLDPFLIIAALPSALAGIVWFLFLTNTRLSVPALTGSIMCMGVATANSILVVTFAREQLEELVGDARRAALNAGYVRLRPVLMTALAMIIGMIPMALGMGDGGEQNAPLGRAVIGGLLLATVATLFFVPACFSVVHGRIERNRRAKGGAAVAVVSDEFDEVRE